MTEFVFRDGVPYVSSKPKTAKEAFREDVPLSPYVLGVVVYPWRDDEDEKQHEQD